MTAGSPFREATLQRLSEAESKELVAGYGVKVPRGRLVGIEPFSVHCASDLTPPLAVKLSAPEVSHKTEVDGVRLGISGEKSLRGAVRAIVSSAHAAGATPDAVLVEEMAPAGTEILVGGIIDPVFGPSILVGLGGIYTEVFGDVQARICPVTGDDIEEMLRALRSFPLLTGARGRRAADMGALIETALAIGGADGLLLKDTRIKEVDLNPVIVGVQGAVAVDARVIRTVELEASDNGSPRAADSPTADFRRLFEPRAIAVVGASSNGRTRANDVLDFTRAMGFDGPIYPIHPKADRIGGLKAYRSFADCPTEIDYAFVAIGANKVTELIDTAAGRVGFAQIMASSFEESGNGVGRGAELLKVARRNGVRLIGPNCLGTYSPRGRISYIRDCPVELGPVGIISQSGGLSTDMLRRGVQRGLRYSGVVSVGNCLDIDPSDLLAFFQEDPQTTCIGLYLESLTDGRRFFETLLNCRYPKPVVILKGGRTSTGQRVALSHTGALAGDDRLWDGLSAQTGAILVSSIDEFLDVLLAFQCIRPSFRKHSAGAFLFGNGGGASVLATDTMSRSGVRVDAPKAETLKQLIELDLGPGTSISNPIDMPSGAMRALDGMITRSVLEILVRTELPDAVVYHINMPQFLTNPSVPATVFENLVSSATGLPRSDEEAPLFLVLRSDGSAEIDERKRQARSRAIKAGIPVFDEIANAITAIARFQMFERFHYRRLCKDNTSNWKSAFRGIGIASAAERTQPGDASCQGS